MGRTSDECPRCGLIAAPEERACRVCGGPVNRGQPDDGRDYDDYALANADDPKEGATDGN